jgi:hypothetical protein
MIGKANYPGVFKVTVRLKPSVALPLFHADYQKHAKVTCVGIAGKQLR